MLGCVWAAGSTHSRGEVTGHVWSEETQSRPSTHAEEGVLLSSVGVCVCVCRTACVLYCENTEVVSKLFDLFNSNENVQ